MNAEQITLVQESFEKVRPSAATAAELFYGRLFEIDPATKPLFKGTMEEQGRKLMDTIGIIAQGLSVPEVILPAVQQLAKRHVGYGVKDEHYASVGAALIWTLEQGLGEEFPSEVREAWTEAYAFLTDVMIEASHEVESDPIMVTLQAQIHAQHEQLKAQQQQIDTTNQLVMEIHQLQVLLQQTGILSQNGSRSRTSWLRRLWQWGQRPMLR